MSLLRRLPLSRLLILCAALVVVGAGAAFATGVTSGPTPPKKPLANAVRDALSAPSTGALSADIAFTNGLVPGSTLSGPKSPLLSGATGRLWVSGDGRAHLELQSNHGDTQIFYDGKTVSLYDTSSQTLYRVTLPQHSGNANASKASTAKAHAPPTVSQIQQTLNQLAQHADISKAIATDVAGQPAYRVRISPRQHGGLIGGAELAWDSSHGIPLDVAIFSSSSSNPVLELKVTNITYGSAPASAFQTPMAKKVVDVNSASTAKSEPSGAAAKHRSAATKRHSGAKKAAVMGVAAVQQALPFTLSAPDQLAGRARNEVRLLHWNGSPAALVTYGQGLDGIAVIERQASQHAAGSGAAAGADAQVQQAHDQSFSLPKVTIAGNPGTVLPTALGTLVNFERAGVSYTVVGSVTESVAKTAAGEL